MSVLKFFVRIGKKIVNKIENTLDQIAEDGLVARGLEADLGLPAGTLDTATKIERPDLTGIDAYLDAIDADDEKRDAAIAALKAYFKFITTFMDAAKTNDPSIIVDETLYAFFQFMTVDLMKSEHPRLYAWMRLIGAIKVDAVLTLEETFAPEVPKNIFSGDYWKQAPAAFEHGYHNFRLDQAQDFVLQDPDDPNLTEDQRVALRQLGVRLFEWSDAGFIGLLYLVARSRKWIGDSDVTIEQMYSWELPYHQPPPLCIEPAHETGIPIPDHIASRMHTLRISTKAGAPAKTSATITQALLVDREKDYGWLFSLRGAVTFEETRGSKERPAKAKITIDARDGLDLIVKFSGDDQVSFSGSPTAGLKLAIAPEKPSTVAPAIAIPDAKGTRLEIGDYAFSVDISPDGPKLKLSTKKSAFVIASSDPDPFLQEVLGSQDRRIEFDFGLTIDKDGLSVDGGGRLSTTISLNRTIGPVTVKTIQVALVPDGDENSSELAFSAVMSFSVKVKAVLVVVEQIGFTVNAGSTSDPPPPGALEIVSGLLYLRELGFKPPTGLGITVQSDLVNGGGFLFYDKTNEEYAGVLQLEIGSRFTFTAIGLLTTKLPDGRKGYSFLVILSLEFNPPLRFGPLAISGLGGLLGIRRGFDTDALRAGLRNRTLDAILFPQDPVANAGRYIAALRTVFPPAADRNVIGPIFKLSLGVENMITAELGLVFEWGTSSRRALIGQLHVRIPPKRLVPIVELHIDAAGIWDPDKGEFSLDATLYDSHIAFVKVSGDVALRTKRGDDAFFLLSFGGYHPEFNAPATFPKLQRMKVALADTDNFRLIVTGYFALTSNTKQFGADVDFKIGAGGFSVEARLSFDALFDKDAGFIIDFDLEVKIKYKGTTYFGVSASGRFSGPEPKRVKGEWTLDLWLFSITRPFDKVLGDDSPPAELPAVDPLPDLVGALKNPQSWSAPLPGGSRTLVTFRDRPGSPEVLIHPLGEIGVRQELLPLGIDLDLYGGGVVTGQRSFSITKAFVGKDELTGLPAVNAQFAAADFLQLTDDEKLHRKSFDSMPAGVQLQPKALAFGGQTPATAAQAAVSEIDFEEIVVDADGNVVRQTKPKTLGPLVLTFAVAFGPAAQSQLRAGGGERFAAPGPAFRVGEERFTVAKTEDLDPVDIAGIDGRSEVAVRQALERHLRENPQDRGALQVVPAFRAEVTA